MSEPVGEVREVLVVAKTHLDVGFTATAAAVRRRYLDDFLPRALDTAAELRRRGGPERLCWTTGSWILTQALGDAPSDLRRDVARGIEAGDLAWHALPFTMHTALADRSLLEHALSLSAALDERFGRRTRAAKLTDVPGHPRALVPLLAAAGVDLLHVGVNPAWPAPEVPVPCRWVDPVAGGEPGVTLLYQPGAYGDVGVLPGGVALAVVMTGDNEGPPAPGDVVATWSALAGRFPGAVVRAATLDDAAAALAPHAGDLPVVTAEIGDPWLHGAASDPPKVAAFRALLRARRSWLADGRARADEPAVSAMSDRLLLLAEHTWGLDQKAHWPETAHWSATDLAARRADGDTVAFEASWAEQRAYLDEAVAALDAGGRGDLAALAGAAVASTVPPPVGETAGGRGAGGEPVDASAPVAVGRWELSLGTDGAVVGLSLDGAPVWGGDGAPTVLGALRLRTWDADDVDRWFAAACPEVADDDRWWATWDNTKPGLDTSGAVSAAWAPRVAAAGRRRRGDREELVVDLVFPDRLLEVGAPPRLVRTTWSAPSGPTAGGPPAELTATLCWYGKAAARWPESTWWEWSPPVSDPGAWRMDVLGEAVDPCDVVAGGGALHAADRLVHPRAELELVDAPLVLPLREVIDDGIPLPAGHAGGPVHGWRVWCHDNRWGTNFPMWCPGDAMFRVVLRVPTA